MTGVDVRAGASWHFVGIGGVGMNGVALLCHNRGVIVSGSDIRRSRIADYLTELGIDVKYGSETHYLPAQAAVVVTSTAIPATNPEIVEARRRGIPILHRSEALAALAQDRKCIGVVGSAGKGTTTGAVSAILEHAGFMPGYYLGWPQYGQATTVRDSESLLVMEIDESDGSMANFSPHTLVITNLHREHLDYYEDLSSMVAAFSRWIRARPPELLVLNSDDPGCRMLEKQLLPDCGIRIIQYGFFSDCDYQGHHLTSSLESLQFEIHTPAGTSQSITAAIGMSYNASNFLAAASVGYENNIDAAIIQAALGSYRGISQRITSDLIENTVVIRAYAAVPESVTKVVEQLCADFGPDEILVAFQPNRAWRLSTFLSDYAAALGKVRSVVITDLAQTFEGQSERHLELAGQRRRNIVSARQLSDAITGHAAFVPEAELPAALASGIGEYRAIAILAGGEVFLENIWSLVQAELACREDR